MNFFVTFDCSFVALQKEKVSVFCRVPAGEHYPTSKSSKLWSMNTIINYSTEVFFSTHPLADDKTAQLSTLSQLSIQFLF